MPKGVAVGTIAILLALLLIFKVLPDITNPQYKEIPCYYYKDSGKGQLGGINESDYSKIKILEGNDRLIVLDTRDRGALRQITESSGYTYDLVD